MDQRTLVVGVGNPILGDDGVGIHVLRELARRPAEGVEYREASLSGLELAESLRGFERVIIIDAVKTAGGKPGDMYMLRPCDIPTLHGISPHDLDFSTALELSGRFGGMPDVIDICAIEVRQVTEFTEELTPQVRSAMPRIIENLSKFIGEGNGS